MYSFVRLKYCALKRSNRMPFNWHMVDCFFKKIGEFFGSGSIFVEEHVKLGPIELDLSTKRHVELGTLHDYEHKSFLFQNHASTWTLQGVAKSGKDAIKQPFWVLTSPIGECWYIYIYVYGICTLCSSQHSFVVAARLVKADVLLVPFQSLVSKETRQKLQIRTEARFTKGDPRWCVDDWKSFIIFL